MCDGNDDLPVAMVPLWQVEQVPMTSAWFTVAPTQVAVEEWQSWQFAFALMCGGETLAVAILPSWQFEHGRSTTGCPAPSQDVVELWQVLHSAVVGVWVARVLPVAVVPLWQLEQTPITSAWFTLAPLQLAVERWQSWQLEFVVMCGGEILAVAVLPSWQLAQGRSTTGWLVEPVQMVVDLWQSLHSAVVGVWLGPLPVAVTLL